jgi:hypothetical protein
MTPLEATDYLRRKVREDADVKLMVTTAVSAGGHRDMFDWASSDPDQVVLVAEAVKDLEDQTDEFSRRLSIGDLS